MSVHCTTSLKQKPTHEDRTWSTFPGALQQQGVYCQEQHSSQPCSTVVQHWFGATSEWDPHFVTKIGLTKLWKVTKLNNRYSMWWKGMLLGAQRNTHSIAVCRKRDVIPACPPPPNTGTLTHCNESHINYYVIPADSKGCCRVEGCGGGCPAANSAKELPHFTWEKAFQHYTNRRT